MWEKKINPPAPSLSPTPDPFLSPHRRNVLVNTFSPTTQKERTQSTKQLLIAVVLSLLGAAGATLLIGAEQVRLALAIGLVVPMLMLATVRLRAAIVVVLVYLVLMGDLRRLLIPMAGWTGFDPLLLLSAIFSGFLCVWAVVSGTLKLDTPIAKWMVVLMAIGVLQIFNPSQGGLIVGVTGAMFFFVPLFWFWIGRTYGTPAFMQGVLFKVIIPLAVLAMLMGLYQSFYGYLPYQMMWYDIAGYTALGEPGSLAPISFFPSASEHASFLASALVVLAAAVMRKHRTALLLIIPLFVALFLGGIRGPVVKVIFTCAILWSVMGRSVQTWVARGLVAVLIGVFGLVWGLNQASQISTDSPVQQRIQRQTELIPTEGGRGGGSTTSIHLYLMMSGYRLGLTEPLGQGIGFTTKAAAKYSEGEGYNTEVDLTNVLVSTGLFGGVIYHIIVVLIILSTIRYWQQTRSVLALAIMGLLAVNFLQWLAGGQYAVSTIVWLFAGALDRFANTDDFSESPELAPQASDLTTSETTAYA